MGFKKTSDLVAVSFSLTESGPNTFTQEEIPLQLDILNNEIAVIVAADLNILPPDALAGTDTDVRATVSATAQVGGPSTLANTNTIALARQFIQAGGMVDSGIGFSETAGEAVMGNLDYIAIVATNNFHVAVQGKNNTLPKGVSGRLWLYRARADAATYAALVQGEVLSA